ncbi:MAG TPA: response regulator [Candidatus Sulfotelmatobacter sp.]|nr:response regulator [Candidatus Sulfotelmatobacter sp.]
MARKILLADDSVTAQNMGRKILADAGYEVVTVNNGSAALKKIGEQRPDLIVLDVYMPGYSGLEVCQRLKESGETARIPILLTVGKLEPFKPEEARRVRADAFIVKPFEASELLSALSKLEDKVVPRPEPSKPGRFARATAALEESHYDKSMAVEEDVGWKSRIVFPKKKKEKEKELEADVDDPAVYNPVNKDLRTVVDHKSPEQKIEEAPVLPPPIAESEENRVNVGAFAPEGLPKDVTPEEIAALAAAAAQVQGIISDEKRLEAVAEIPPAQQPDSAQKADIKADIKEEIRSVDVAVSSSEAAPASEAPVTLAEQPKADEAEKKAEVEPAPIPAEVGAAIAGLEQQAPAQSSNSGRGSWSDAANSDEPVTMAIAAAAGAGPTSSRWTAVAVALAPEEAAISLEQEMQKAYAAFAAAESGHIPVPAVSAIPEPAPAPQAETTVPRIEEPLAPVAEVPAISAPEAVAPLAEVASAAKEAVTAAVKEFETVASSYVAQEPVTPSEAVAEPSPIIATAPVTEASPIEQPSATEPISVPEIAAETKSTEPESVAVAEETVKAEDANKNEEIAAPAAEVSAPASVSQSFNESSEIPAAPKKEAVAEVASSESVSPRAGGIDEMAKKESEISANTAAAWASWRKIREDKPASAAGSAKDEETPQDTAAMAVAAGAERKPEEAGNNFDADPEIASIVDSVLADMRPRIVEEIAKKLGKKK